MARQRRQLDLRRAAAALSEGAGEAVTMATVARRLGVAKPTLYRLVRGRDELVALCVDAEAERLLDHLYAAFGRGGDGSESQLTAALGALARYREDSPGGFALLFDGRYPEARAAVRRVEDRVHELLRRDAGARGQQPPASELIAAALLGAAAAVARRSVEDGRDADSTAVATAIVRPSGR